jgi:hypothetical protein
MGSILFDEEFRRGFDGCAYLSDICAGLANLRQELNRCRPFFRA